MRFLGYRGGEGLDFDVLPSNPVYSDRWPILLLSVRRWHSLPTNRTKFQKFLPISCRRRCRL